MATKVRELRDKLGLSQSKFAAHFSDPPIPVRTVQNWEQGVQNPPPYVVGMMERIVELESQKVKGENIRGQLELPKK